MNIEQRLEFINTLPPLKPEAIRSFLSLNETPTPPHDNNGPNGFVTPDSVNIFLPGFSESLISDINLCKLVMQNSADIEYPDTTQQFEWYKHYTKGLSDLGWTIQAKNLQDVTIKGINLTMDQVAIDVIKGLVGNNANLLTNLAKQAITAIQGDEKLITLFESNKKLGKQSKFDIAPAWLDSNGQANMVLNTIALDNQESTTSFLFWKTTKQSTTIKSGAMHIYLDNAIFDALRGELREVFLNEAKSKIRKLPKLKPV